MAIKQRSKTSIALALDRVERAICLLLAEYRCECCEHQEGLHWCHIVERSRHRALQWHRHNSLILCKDCHYIFDHQMTDRQRWKFVEKYRPGAYDILDELVGAKFDLTAKQMLELLDERKAELKEIKGLAI